MAVAIMNNKYTGTVDIFVKNLLASNKSKDTISSYKATLNKYGAFLQAKNLDETAPSTIVAWKNELYDTGVKPTTVALYLRHIKLFFDFAVQLKYYSESPCVPVVMSVEVPRGKQPYKGLLTENDYIRLVYGEKPNKFYGSVWPRNQAIITILLSSAIRNSELCALTLADLDFVNGYITVECGKGNKYRRAAFPKVAQEAVKRYLKSGYRPANLGEKSPLFGTLNSKSEFIAFNRTALSALVERTVRAVTGREGIRSHALRHSSASIMWDKGLSMDKISEILGHEDIKVTERYLDRLKPNAPITSANSIFDNIEDRELLKIG